MNILIVHNKYHFPGGEDTVVNQDTHLLESHGHKVFHYYRSNDEISTMHPLQKLILPFTAIYSKKTYHEISSLIVKNQIELVHVHNTFLITSFSAYYAAKKHGCTLVQTIHNFRFICPNALLFRDGCLCEDCLKHGLLSSIKHSCYRNSKLQTATVATVLKVHRWLHTFAMPDAYITMTEFNKKKLSSIIPSEKFHFKANYLELVATQDEAIALPEQPYFVYAARLQTVKGIFTLLEAFRELPDQQLLVIGNGEEEEAVKAYIEAHHMTNVCLLGYLPHNQTVTYFKHAKAMIFPSLLYEGGFPLTIIECYSVGTPVIVSDSPNISDQITEGYNGFQFCTGSSTSLAAKIREFDHLTSDSAYRKQLSQNVYDFYMQNYTEEIVYQRMMEIYSLATKHSQDII